MHGSTWSYLNNLISRTKIGETTDGKSVCRMHTLRATCYEHNWTCSVPWLVFLLCVKTLQMTMTIRQGETTCRWHIAVKASNAGSNARSSYYRDVRGQRSNVPSPWSVETYSRSWSCQERLHDMTDAQKVISVLSSHKASKETWPEKNQLRVEKKQTNRRNICSTTNKELHNHTLGTLADTRKHLRVCMHQELLDHCPTWRRSRKWAFVRNFWTDCLLHVTMEPSSWLRQKPTKDLTHGTISFQHRIRRNEQTVKVCAVCVSLILRGATLSTQTELEMKITKTSVSSMYPCLHDFQWCGERCCTARSKRQNNYQTQQALNRRNTNNREEEQKYWDKPQTEAVRQNTADDMTMMHEGETMKQKSGSTCPVPVVLSKQATHAPRLTVQTLAPCWAKKSPPQKMRNHFRWSPSPAHADLMLMDLPMTQTSPAELQNDRRHTETDSTLRLSGAGHSRSSHFGSFRSSKSGIRMRRDPIMLWVLWPL